MRSLAAFSLLILMLSRLASGASPEADSARASWYEGPQLFVMTGFIANTTSGTWGLDFIGKGEWSREQQLADLAEWNKGLGRDYDPDATVKAFKEAGATGVIFYDKWHDGLVPHKTKHTNFMTERDLLGDTLKALRKHGMKIVVYYSVGLDANPEPKFKDWVCRDAAGKPMGRCFPGDWMSFYSPYRQYVIDHLIEIMNKYGPFHGFYLDLYTQPVPLSRDKYTAQAFQKEYGKPVEEATEAEAVEFNIKTLEEYLQEIREAITTVRPDIEFTFNGAGRADATLPKRARRVDGQADWFSIEGHSRERIDSIATVGQGWDRPFETGILLNTSWYVPMSDEAPRSSMSREEAIVSAGSVFIRGGNVFAAMTPGHSGVYNTEEDVARLRAVGDWLKGNKEWIQGSQPFAEIGIYRGDPSDDLVKAPAVGEIWDRTYPHSDRRRYARSAGAVPGSETDLTLRRLGYLTRLTGSAFAKEPFDPKAHRLVVLPENAPLSDKMADKLREYVRGGGNLIAFGFSSRFDENANLRDNFALADVFGVDYAGHLPGYKTMMLLPDSELIRRLRGNPGAVTVKLTTGRVLAKWEFAGRTPAVVENEFGQGRAIYISGEELGFGQSPDVLGELTRRLIGDPAVSVEGDRDYSLTMNRKGNDRILYLVNNTTGSRTNLGGRSTAEVLPSELTTTKEQVQLTLSTDRLGELTRVSLIPSNQEIRFSREPGSITMYLDASPSITTLRLEREK